MSDLGVSGTRSILEYWDGCEDCAENGYRCILHRDEEDIVDGRAYRALDDMFQHSRAAQNSLREALKPFAEAWDSEYERWKSSDPDDGDVNVIENWADSGLEFSQTGLTWANLRAARAALAQDDTPDTEVAPPQETCGTCGGMRRVKCPRCRNGSYYGYINGETGGPGDPCPDCKTIGWLPCPACSQPAIQEAE